MGAWLHQGSLWFAGWAWFLDEQNWRSGGWSLATNNQAELMAVLDCLYATADLHDTVHILCDSQYVIRSLTEWLPGWKRRRWRKGDGKPVLNREFFELFDQILPHRHVTFEWVKGHAGHPMNERVDELARHSATAFAGGPGALTGCGLGAPDRPCAPDLVALREPPATLF